MMFGAAASSGPRCERREFRRELDADVDGGGDFNRGDTGHGRCDESAATPFCGRGGRGRRGGSDDEEVFGCCGVFADAMARCSTAAEGAVETAAR
jgi:hypothetical protein